MADFRAAAEKAAIELLPSRLPQIYPLEWGEATFANMRRQLEVARSVGLVTGEQADGFWVDLGAGA